MSCGSCKVKFSSREQTLSCDGLCGCQYHHTCCNVSSDILKALGKIPGLSWHCDKCSVITKKIDLGSLKQFFEEKMQAVFRDVENVVVNMKRDFTQIATDKLEEVRREIVHLSGNMNTELSLTVPGTSKSNIPAANLYSTALKSKSAVIIKPKNTAQKNYETKTDILRNVNPIVSDINISSVKNISHGGVVIGCSNETEVVKLKSLANSKLGGRYEIKDVQGISPRIRVVGMSEKLEEEELANYVKCQNKNLFKDDQSQCKVLRIWPTKKRPYLFQAVLQVDTISYNNIMSIGSGKLFVGLDVCEVYDSVELRRCFKCNGYNHHSSTCKSVKVYCPRCAAEHNLKECKASGDNLRCINCIKFNENNKDSYIDVNHAAWDSKCHVYCQNIEEYKTRIYVS